MCRTSREPVQRTRASTRGQSRGVRTGLVPEALAKNDRGAEETDRPGARGSAPQASRLPGGAARPRSRHCRGALATVVHSLRRPLRQRISRTERRAAANGAKLTICRLNNFAIVGQALLSVVQDTAKGAVRIQV